MSDGGKGAVRDRCQAGVLVAAQDSFSHAGSQQKDRQQPKTEPYVDEELIAALAVLGVARAASESEITKAYRKLINQYHPDKLIDKGFPPEMLAAANERFRSIRNAYEYLKKTHFRSGAA